VIADDTNWRRVIFEDKEAMGIIARDDSMHYYPVSYDEAKSVLTVSGEYDQRSRLFTAGRGTSRITREFQQSTRRDRDAKSRHLETYAREPAIPLDRKRLAITDDRLSPRQAGPC